MFLSQSWFKALSIIVVNALVTACAGRAGEKLGSRHVGQETDHVRWVILSPLLRAIQYLRRLLSLSEHNGNVSEQGPNPEAAAPMLSTPACEVAVSVAVVPWEAPGTQSLLAVVVLVVSSGPSGRVVVTVVSLLHTLDTRQVDVGSPDLLRVQSEHTPGSSDACSHRW